MAVKGRIFQAQHAFHGTRLPSNAPLNQPLRARIDTKQEYFSSAINSYMPCGGTRNSADSKRLPLFATVTDQACSVHAFMTKFLRAACTSCDRLLQVLQIQRTPEELAADAREEKQDMLSSGAQWQQAAEARDRNRALREKDKQQRIEGDKAAKLAKRRAANRERMQRLRNEDAFRELEVCCASWRR
jgi:hypothetical protein